MARRHRIVERRWLDTGDGVAGNCLSLIDVVRTPRTDLLVEASPVPVDETAPDQEVGPPSAMSDRAGSDRDSKTLRYTQQTGPFAFYERTLRPDWSVSNGDRGTASRDAVSARPSAWIERTEYRYALPAIGWLIAVPVRRQLGRRGAARPSKGLARPPWWAPPDILNSRQLSVLELLIIATIAAAYMNTLFSQTSTFAADAFGVDEAALGRGGAIVRLGMIVSLPLALAADRVGRRRVLIITAFAAPTFAVLGALAPTFGALVASQTIARPLAITLDMVLAVVAAEEMPKNSRAYAVAVMAMTYGFGAGLVVMGLPLADLGPEWWRIDYALALAWITIGVAFVRRLPESIRFTAPHVRTWKVDPKRLLLMSAAVVAGNFFVAPAAFYLNRYLSDVRELSAAGVALFTLSVGTPAGLGLVIGGKLADRRGRRGIIVIAIPISAALIVASYSFAGFTMWLTSLAGATIAGVAAPALLVYRAEMFPTGNRGMAAGLVNVAALVAGSLSIWQVGAAVDRGTGFGAALAVCAIGQLIVVALVAFGFPESANKELEELNELDEAIAISNL